MTDIVETQGLAACPPGTLDVSAVYEAHADFVWASLHRMGVRRDDLPDVMQEVFVVVHRRRGSFDGTSALRTWLYGICLRVASNHRRRAHRRRERPVAEPPDDRVTVGTASTDPERQIQVRRARRTAEALLDRLSTDHRAVFVMFEVEGMSCDEIARTVGVPVGTVYSRLHAARRRFARELARWQAGRRRER